MVQQDKLVFELECEPLEYPQSLTCDNRIERPEEPRLQKKGLDEYFTAVWHGSNDGSTCVIGYIGLGSWEQLNSHQVRRCHVDGPLNGTVKAA